MSLASGPGELWSRTNFAVSIDGLELGCRDVRGLGSTSALARAPTATVATAPVGAGAGSQAGEPPALTAGWAAVGALPGVPQPPLTADGSPARLEWLLTPIVLIRGLDGSRQLYDWRANIVAGLTDAREVLIRLLDGAGGVPVQVWRLKARVAVELVGARIRRCRGRPGVRARRACLREPSVARQHPVRRRVMPETVPYGAFNFLVDLGTGSAHGPDAGFEECGPLAEELDVIEYRNGNEPQSEPHKLPGLPRAADVTLKRGVIGTTTLYTWFDEVRTQGATAARTVTITLVGDDHSTAVLIWKLVNAWPVRYSGGPLHGRASMIALEELTLTYERLELTAATS